jgi:hypothetical protein
LGFFYYFFWFFGSGFREFFFGFGFRFGFRFFVFCLYLSIFLVLLSLQHYLTRRVLVVRPQDHLDPGKVSNEEVAQILLDRHILIHCSTNEEKFEV